MLYGEERERFDRRKVCKLLISFETILNLAGHLQKLYRTISAQTDFPFDNSKEGLAKQTARVAKQTASTQTEAASTADSNKIVPGSKPDESQSPMPAQAYLTTVSQTAEAEQHQQTARGQNEQDAVSTVAARQGGGEQGDSDVPSTLSSECGTSKFGCKEKAETRTKDQEVPQAYHQQKEADKEEEEEDEQNENAFLEHVDNVAAALAASD